MPGIPTGKYRLSKEDSDSYNYRISHPLAKWVIDNALRTVTGMTEIEFDYDRNPTIISIIEQNRGNSGYLSFRVVRYSSLKEVEEHILLVAIDSSGNEMEESFAKRLLTVPARVIGSLDNNFEQKEMLNGLIENRMAVLQEELEIRNSDIVNSEVIKIENWVEDNRRSLQQKLIELDKAIEEKNTEFIQERNIRKKLAIQKEKDVLNEKRDLAWKEYDEKREKLKSDKNALISQLYELADGKMEIVDEFMIKWRIK